MMIDFLSKLISEKPGCVLVLLVILAAPFVFVAALQGVAWWTWR
jgi:hypothetical protein